MLCEWNNEIPKMSLFKLRKSNDGYNLKSVGGNLEGKVGEIIQDVKQYQREGMCQKKKKK